MKRLASIMLILVALIWSVPVITPLLAQTTAEEDVYVVQQNDTLYRLSGVYLNDPEKWREVLTENPFLTERGRIRELEDGRIIVIIRPGEVLRGLQRLGIMPDAVGTDQLPPVAESTIVEFKNSTAEVETAFGMAMTLAWLLLALVTVAAIWAIWAYKTGRLVSINEEREREMRLDPVTSGPPIIVGGVRSTETERLSRAMETAAVTEYLRLNPNVDRTSVRVDRIGPVEEGMISGSGMVGYADRARSRTIDPPQPGYRARFRFQDGREDNLMSLQGCMNPCYYGEGFSGFTFEPRQTVVATPEPERTAPQPVAHPAMVARATRTAAEGEGHSTVTIGDKVLEFGRGAHFTVDEATGTIGLEGQAFSMTLKPKRVRKERRGKADLSTGTGS